VSNRHGIAHLYAINSSDIELAIPIVEMYPFEEMKVDETNEEKIEDNNNTRIEKILSFITP